MPRTPDIHPCKLVVSVTCVTLYIVLYRTHRIIAKEDTAKGGESAHEVRFDGDRRLDPIDIGRARYLKSGNSASWHGGGRECVPCERRRRCCALSVERELTQVKCQR
jgi:hypothetical protein